MTITMTDQDVSKALSKWQAWIRVSHIVYGRLIAQQADPRHALGREAEGLVARKLVTLGYEVATTRHKEHFDLVINDTLKIEVKATIWRRDEERGGGRGRYQANMRKSQADLVILMVRNGQGDSFFVIPHNELAGQRSITIRCWNPASYTGRFSQYREAWHLVAPALAEAQQNQPKQLSLAIE